MTRPEVSTTRRLDWRTKSLPPAAEGCAPGDLAALGLNLLAGDLMMPAAVLKDAALRHNIAAMQDFADRIGARLCPHGKTSMSPELFGRQLEAGAWGMTAATPHHVRIYRRLGIGRVFLANQLVGRADTAFILEEIGSDPDFDFYALADSVEAVDCLAEAARNARCPRPVQLLVEIGAEGARTGVRNAAAALALARHIKAAKPWVGLRGVETFEGVRMTAADARAEAAGMIDAAVAATAAIGAEGLFGDGTVLLSAGGSAFLDLCAAQLPSEIGGRRVERVIRPGCYVTHDHGIYERLTRPKGSPLPGLRELQPALEVWGVVLSVPEERLAIVGVGKRDVSNDIGPPRPIWRHGVGSTGPEPAAGLEVVALWDQHLSLAMPVGALQVGDLVGFGISHPCATFDRWSALLTVDARYRVTGVVQTLF
jgi:D-serine dehydratase